MDKGSRNGGVKLFVGSSLMRIYLSNFYELNSSYEVYSLGPINLWYLANEVFGRDCIMSHKREYHVISNKPDKALEKVTFYDLLGLLSTNVRFSDNGLILYTERRDLDDDGFEESPHIQFRDFLNLQEDLRDEGDGMQGDPEHAVTIAMGVLTYPEGYYDITTGHVHTLTEWLTQPLGWEFNFLSDGLRERVVSLLVRTRLPGCGTESPVGRLVKSWLNIFNSVTVLGRGYDTEAEQFCASLDDSAHYETADDAVKTAVAAILLRLVYHDRHGVVKDSDRVAVLALMAAILYGNRVEVKIQPGGGYEKECVLFFNTPMHQLLNSFTVCCGLYPILGLTPYYLDIGVRSDVLDYVSTSTFWVIREIHRNFHVIDVLRHISCEHQLNALLR